MPDRHSAGPSCVVHAMNEALGGRGADLYELIDPGGG